MKINKKIFPSILLGVIIFLGIFLRFYKLGAYSLGNTYYAAAVQSMLTSWHNFFFVAYEPGGSVTVDKPPLGLWIQTGSAYLFGLNGFALALPQVVAGVLSIPLIYILVKRSFGVWPGLIAAFILATFPVTISTERNNTIDGLLLFAVLLATWAFLVAIERRQFAYLLLGAFLIGLGFNIKMMQAFLPLPALYAAYFLGTPYTLKKRVLQLSGATIVLVLVSLSWAIIVDLTPASERPFIGSTQSNLVMELMVGHNGISRLFGPGILGGGPPGGPGGPPGNGGPPGGGPGPGAPAGGGPPNQQGGGPPGGGPPSSETGFPNPVRLFIRPLVIEGLWLLPLALIGIFIALPVLSINKWHSLWSPAFTETYLNDKQVAVVLWGGWLSIEFIFFSIASFYHAYYLLMLGPPLAAMVAITIWAMWHRYQQNAKQAVKLWGFLAGGTIVFQILTLLGVSNYVILLAILAGLLFLVGLGIYYFEISSDTNAFALTFIALMIAPLLWSILTILNPNPDVMLPRAGPDRGAPARADAILTLTPSQQAIFDYLLTHAQPKGYLVATLSAGEASRLILLTHRPILTFGGFNGQDNIIDVEQLAAMVEQKELQFVLGGEGLERSKLDIAAWLADHCIIVALPTESEDERKPDEFQGPPPDDTLYDCYEG